MRVRDALRALVDESPGRWDKPSLFILRNRLLDRTGSDARPLAEFLLEAVRRGWRDRLPTDAVESSRFDAMVAPFVLQWSRERFVQPDMARWAVESWAYALRVIDESQIRIAPPPKRESVSAMAARLNAGAAAAGAQTALTARAVAASMAAPASGPSAAGSRPHTAVAAAGKGPQTATGGRGTARGTVGAPQRFNPAYTPRARSNAKSVPTWLPKALFGTICAMGLGLVVRVGIANVTGEQRTTDVLAQVQPSAAMPPGMEPPRAAVGSAGPTLSGAPANSPSAAMSAPMPSLRDSEVTRPLGSTTAGSPIVNAPLPAATELTSARTVAPSLTGGVQIMAPERPGVPAITRGMYSTGADSARMVFVQPARRAAGDGRRMQTSSTATAITYDEAQFVNGDIVRGRVEVIRAGTVIFRDMRTGLRHEYRKDDIAQIITEFGSTVRFRGEPTAMANDAGAKSSGGAAGAAARAGAKARMPAATSGIRARGVAGRYRVRYAAASAVGSPECTQVWTRAPNAEDIAVVSHTAGADTLAVAFEGGDVFPSNVDPDGYFASTFRIVPDQARTMTALTTRLNGKFGATGALDLTVNIVFYRRLRSGEVTCNVTVKAAGQREN